MKCIFYLEKLSAQSGTLEIHSISFCHSCRWTGLANAVTHVTSKLIFRFWWKKLHLNLQRQICIRDFLLRRVVHKNAWHWRWKICFISLASWSRWERKNLTSTGAIKICYRRVCTTKFEIRSTLIRSTIPLAKALLATPKSFHKVPI